MRVQEMAIYDLQQLGVRVLTSGGEDLTETDDPSRVMIRQIMGVFSQYEKSKLVQKLRVARDRKSKSLGYRVDGRRHKAENLHDLAEAARRLHRKPPKGKRRSLREVSEELAKFGYVRSDGQLMHAMTVKRLIEATIVRPPSKAFRPLTT